MAEIFDLSAPTGPQTSRWLVKGITLERGIVRDEAGVVSYNPAGSFVEVILVGDNGQHKVHRWSGAGADADIVGLNKANLTTNSLHKRILNRLVTDGVITGSVSGTPD